MNTLQAAWTMAGVWVLVATTLFTLHQATAAPTVNAPWGRIQGRDSVSVSGMKYSAYLAIPFALPPVGELRFAKPVAHPGLEDGQVFDATTLGDQCVQLPGFSSSAVGMSEDCLTLNVYVPVSLSSGPKSVMVWIHGTSFNNGGAPTYTPSELVTQNDVIVVVIQYRLDVFGFLSSGDDTVPGNFGLWDQNMAIRWVKTNIGAFGGDPESMTLFGQAAGAVSAGYQTISPASKGLTFRAILQSGTPLAPWVINKNPGRAFNTLASLTGCLDGVASPLTDSNGYYFTSEAQRRAGRSTVLACLRTLDATELVRVLPLQEGTTFVDMLLWLPVMDGVFLPEDPALLMSNVTYLEAVGATERDVILGVNNDEGALVVNFRGFFGDDGNTTEGRRKVLRSILENHLIFLFGEDLQKDPQRLKTLVNLLEFFYTQASNNGAETVSIQNVADAVADVNFVLNTVMFARRLSEAKAETSSPGRQYLYLFNYFPIFRADLPELKGTTLGDDLAYTFDPVIELGNRQGFTEAEDAIGFIFRTILTSFAKNGQPEVPLLNNQISGFVWPEFTLTQEEYLSLELVSRVESRLFGRRVALWTDLSSSTLKSTRSPKPTRYRTC